MRSVHLSQIKFKEIYDRMVQEKVEDAMEWVHGLEKGFNSL